MELQRVPVSITTTIAGIEIIGQEDATFIYLPAIYSSHSRFKMSLKKTSANVFKYSLG